jgi:acyl carrier protein
VPRQKVSAQRTVRDVVRDVLVYELGFETVDLEDATRVWDIGVDSLDLDYLFEALSDELDAQLSYPRWRLEVAARPELTFAELVEWCGRFAPRGS